MERKKFLQRSASSESSDSALTMKRSIKKKRPKERWLLTRKTWRYMADAGRKLIPEGIQNRTEDIPKIEAHFQDICKKEARFLLWRKNSYPGALTCKNKLKDRRKSGSYRKVASADDVQLLKPERPKNLPLIQKYNLKQMRKDFFNRLSPSSTNYLPLQSGSHGTTEEEQDEGQLIRMLEKYLSIGKCDKSVPTTSKYRPEFNYQDLIDKLQRHLDALKLVSSNSSISSYSPSVGSHVHFSGDHVQKSLSETLSRYYSQSSKRDHIISDLLTDRKALEKLYFELRKTKGFRGGRGGSGYASSSNYSIPQSRPLSSLTTRSKRDFTNQPPLIEIDNEIVDTIQYHDWGIQTLTIPETILQEIEKEYKKNLAEAEEEEKRELKLGSSRRRSSAENDDISQSVSDTIKRYLRMARKKSVDSDKADRFKRVNYDRNLRNIKAKGEITKPGDDDGLNKGCQTNDDWILKYRELKFDEIYQISDNDSRVSSSRSSIDDIKSNQNSPPATQSKSHSFLSHLLHKHHEKSHPAVAVQSSLSTSGMAMQKSKSSSSVMHHGSRLMAKKIFRSRSKSQTRPSQGACSWTPQGNCIWTNLTGKQVTLSDNNLLYLTEIERKVLQKVALAKLQALNLGVTIKVPSESVGGNVVTKPKRRPYLLKRKAITTSIFDTNRKDNDKDGNNPTGGLVFGIPLTQCVENDRLARININQAELLSGKDHLSHIPRHGSRSSFSSLIDSPRGDEEGDFCESLMMRERIVGSVPGLLDALSCSASTTDLPGNVPDEEGTLHIPNILNVCFRYLEQHGLHTLGIFRVSTSKKRIRQLRQDFDCGKETNLDEEQCPHDVATLLKEYLRDLPDPLLCRDLYHAFIQTQRIRNRRLQLESLQHLIQLLPLANRDTLFALLAFLAQVAKNSADSRNDLGQVVSGNKMDSSNLATVFAPNILHCIKPSSKDIHQDKPEDRIDIINVVRTLIDYYKHLFTISSQLLDEVYIHMMDSYPEELEQLLNKKDILSAAEESVEELDSESNSNTWSPTTKTPQSTITIDNVIVSDQITEPKKTYSREEFLHEAAATGGPNVGMRIRHKDRSNRRKRDNSLIGKRKEDEATTIGSSAKNIISKLRGQRDSEDNILVKTRSSSIESTSSYTDSDIGRILRMGECDKVKSIDDNNGVITASLTIPVQSNQGFSLNMDDDIPFIEDAESGRQQLTIGLVRTPSIPPRRRQRSISGSDSSSTSNIQPITGSINIVQGHGYDSAMSSASHSSPLQNTPTSEAPFSSPTSWTSSPPTSPDSIQTSVNYIPDENISLHNKTKPTLQKVSITSTQQIQQVNTKTKTLPKSMSTTSLDTKIEREKLTPSISNIGNAVLKSRTADFERITTKSDNNKSKSSTTAEKKKYTKRRYTDSRHQTRHIPDSETLESTKTTTTTTTTTTMNVISRKDSTTSSSGGQTAVYKRRELISSVPSK